MRRSAAITAVLFSLLLSKRSSLFLLSLSSFLFLMLWLLLVVSLPSSTPRSGIETSPRVFNGKDTLVPEKEQPSSVRSDLFTTVGPTGT